MKLKDLIEQYGEYTVPQELIEKLEPPKPKTVWDLEEGDNYILETDTGGLMDCEVRHKEIFEKSREVGNVFLDQYEALEDIERRKVETLLIKHGGRRWFKKNRYNYFIRADDEHPFWIDELKDNANQGTIYFSTFEDVEKAISEIGEERIKKALFEER